MKDFVKGSYTLKLYNSVGVSPVMRVYGKEVYMDCDDIFDDIVDNSVYESGKLRHPDDVFRFSIDGSQFVTSGQPFIVIAKGLEARPKLCCPQTTEKSVVLIVRNKNCDILDVYDGDSIKYENCSSLSNTICINIDGKLMYIHDMNFQIISKPVLLKSFSR